jgi:hypothetical protein
MEFFVRCDLLLKLLLISVLNEIIVSFAKQNVLLMYLLHLFRVIILFKQKKIKLSQELRKLSSGLTPDKKYCSV